MRVQIVVNKTNIKKADSDDGQTCALALAFKRVFRGSEPLVHYTYLRERVGAHLTINGEYRYLALPKKCADFANRIDNTEKGSKGRAAIKPISFYVNV